MTCARLPPGSRPLPKTSFWRLSTPTSTTRGRQRPGRPKSTSLITFCASSVFLLSLTKETSGDARGQGAVGAVQQVWHRDGDHQDWKVRKWYLFSMWSSSNSLIWWYHVIIRVSGEILEQKGDVGGKCCDIILQIWFFVIVILRAMPQNYWYLGWWCTIHSIHCTFELARGSITDLSDTCKKFIGGWLDDQMEKFARYFPTRPPATATIWIWMSRRSPPLSLSKVYPGTNVKQGKSTITNMENRDF